MSQADGQASLIRLGLIERDRRADPEPRRIEHGACRARRVPEDDGRGGRHRRRHFNVLAPGRIATDRVASLDEAAVSRTGRSVDEVRESSQASIPTHRYGRPEEFGAVAAFLSSAQASYVTGTIVRCDGGYVPVL